MRKLSALLFFFLPLACFGQYTLSGRIINKADKSPVASASVFLNNTLVGARTADNGSFLLVNVRPGQYDLVVSIVGFEIVHQNISVHADAHLPDIEISPKTILLSEVKVGPNRDWDRDLQTFKRLFFGTSDFAADCKILNPDLLDFDYDASALAFTAKSSDFLEIENKALGYRIRYLLKDFKNDGRSGILYFEGLAAFEEMKGKPSELRKWQKNRQKVYLGSSMHFLRSAISNAIATEGFRVLRMIRKPNPKSDGSLRGLYNETLVTSPYLSVNDFIRPTNIPGQYAMGFNDCLYVLYAKKWAHAVKKDNPSPKTENPVFLDDPATTTVIFDAPFAFFDSNGIVINPESLVFEGQWGKSLMAELLPVDYEP